MEKLQYGDTSKVKGSGSRFGPLSHKLRAGVLHKSFNVSTNYFLLLREGFKDKVKKKNGIFPSGGVRYGIYF